MRQRRALVAALSLDALHQHDLAALDDFLDLVLTAWPEGTLRHLLQDVVAADGFDEFFLGVLALVVVVVAFVAARGGDISVTGGGAVAMVLGMCRVVVMRRIFASMILMAVFVAAKLVLGARCIGRCVHRDGVGCSDRRAIGQNRRAKPVAQVRLQVRLRVRLMRVIVMLVFERMLVRVFMRMFVRMFVIVMIIVTRMFAMAVSAGMVVAGVLKSLGVTLFGVRALGVVVARGLVKLLAECLALLAFDRLGGV